MPLFRGRRGPSARSSSTASAARPRTGPELAPLLVPNHRLLVPDLPGHGGSAALPARLGPRAVRGPGGARRRARGMLPAPVVGHSLGGAVVLRLALRQPDDVSAVVLAAAAGLSIGSIWGRQLQSVFSAVRPGRLAARWRGLVSRSLAAPPVRLRFRVRRRSRLADQRGCRGFLAAQLLHTGRRQRVAGAARGRPASGARGGALPGAGPLGSGRHCSCRSTTRSSTRAGCAHRLRVIPGCGHLLIGERPDACARRDRRLSRRRRPRKAPPPRLSPLPAGPESRRDTQRPRRRCASVRRPPTCWYRSLPSRPILRPFARYSAHSCACRSHTAIRKKSVSPSFAAAVDREPERGEPLVLAELTQLDVGGQVADRGSTLFIDP